MEKSSRRQIELIGASIAFHLINYKTPVLRCLSFLCQFFFNFKEEGCEGTFVSIYLILCVAEKIFWKYRDQKIFEVK